MNLLDIIYDPGSTTKAFKYLTSDYKLEILFSGFNKNLFRRIIVIKLDDIPVMLAVSETSIENDVFLDILQNAHTTPIGTKLFSPELGIKRGEMQVMLINVTTIDDPVITDYIKMLSAEKQLYFRISIFSSNTQSMELKEYILPGLEFIINKYTQRIDKLD